MKKHLLFLATCLACSAIVLVYSHAEAVSMANDGQTNTGIHQKTVTGNSSINKFNKKHPDGYKRHGSSMLAISAPSHTSISR